MNLSPDVSPATTDKIDSSPDSDLSVPAPQPNPSAALDLDQIEARLASDRLVSPVLDVLVREDVPALVAEVRRLRETVEALAQSTSDLGRDLLIEGERADAAVAEAARVREALQAIREWAEGDYGGAKRPIDVWPGLRRALDAALGGAE